MRPSIILSMPAFNINSKMVDLEVCMYDESSDIRENFCRETNFLWGHHPETGNFIQPCHSNTYVSETSNSCTQPFQKI